MPDGLILALDFGGTKHAAAICALGERSWLQKRQSRVPAGSNMISDMEIILAHTKDILQDRPVAAVGVSFGGPVDFTSGVVKLSHHVPGWENYPLKQHLEEQFGAPVIVDNDANAAALGEFGLGAGKGCNSLFYITISTGVGGGWILDHQIWRGANSLAGEVGHMTLDPAGPKCLCGKKGCLERFASGPYLVEDVVRELNLIEFEGTDLYRLAGGKLANIDAKMIAQAARLGDDISTQRLGIAAWAVGTAVGNCANLLNPDRIVLGGGVMGAGEAFWAEIRSRARQVALPEVEIEIVPAGLGTEAPLWGAALLAEGTIMN